MGSIQAKGAKLPERALGAIAARAAPTDVADGD
jgi:hypothetical protein